MNYNVPLVGSILVKLFAIFSVTTTYEGMNRAKRLDSIIRCILNTVFIQSDNLKNMIFDAYYVQLVLRHE